MIVPQEHRAIRGHIAERTDALLSGGVELPHDLYPYQCETLARTSNWLRDLEGTQRGYIEHATGLGKTIFFSALIHACPDLRVLVIVPTKVLIEQTAPQITKFTSGMVGHVSSLDHIRDADGNVVALPGHDYSNIVVTTDESFITHARTLAADFRPHLIFWDECHWAYHPTARAALAQFPEAVIIGLSATPDFLSTIAKPGAQRIDLDNGRALYADPKRTAAAHFGTKLDERSVRWGIEEGWLAPLAWGQIAFDVSLDGVATRETGAGLDFDERRLQSLLAEHWSVMSEAIIRLYLSGEYDLPNRQTYAICPSVKESERLAASLRTIGVPAACISGDTPTRERRKLLARFAHGELRFITSVMVLREGWDAPNAEVCLMLRPTKSRTLYLQAIGRALRRALHDAHKVALVLDAHFQRSKFLPLSAPRLLAPAGAEIVNGGILVGPRPHARGGKDAIVSPYLPKEAQPKIVITDALDEIEYWAGQDGTFEADGDTWGTLTALQRLLGLSRLALTSRVTSSGARARPGRGNNGRPLPFYALTDVRTACADLLEGTPPDAEWMTIETIATLLQASPATIRTLAQRGAVRSRSGKSRAGRIIDFFSFEDARLEYSALQSLPRTREDGTFEHGNETWLGLRAAGQLLNVSYSAIKARIQNDDSVRMLQAINRSGRVEAHYALHDLRRVCSDLLEDLPIAESDGTFTVDGEVWGTTNALAARIGVSETLLRGRLRTRHPRTRRGKWNGQRTSFISLEDIRYICSDALENLPIANADGTFMASGKEWGTISGIAKKFRCANSAVRRLVRQHDYVAHRRGLTHNGQQRNYYDIAAIAPLLREREGAHAVGSDGIVERDGERWATIVALQSTLGISYRTIKSRCEKLGMRTLPGRTPNGAHVGLYCVSETRRACADLLERLPVLVRNGTFTADGETWGTLTALAGVIGCKPSTLIVRARKHGHDNLQTREARAQLPGRTKGVILTCFALSPLRDLCADLLEDPPQAGPDGTFEPQLHPTMEQEPSRLGRHGIIIIKDEAWMTEKAAQRKLHVHPRTFKRFAREGRIRTREVQGQKRTNMVVYSIADIERELSEGRESIPSK